MLYYGVIAIFTDNILAGFVNQLSVELKFDGGKNKVLLRAYTGQMSRYGELAEAQA